MTAALSTYSIMPCGRVTKTDLSLVEQSPKRFVYVLSHDVDFRPNGTGHDRYVLTWDASSDIGRIEAYLALDEMAADSEFRLDWPDVKRIKWLVDTIGQTIDPEKYAGYRQQM